MKKLLFLLCFILYYSTYAQDYKITYKEFYNDKESPNLAKKIIANKNMALVMNEQPNEQAALNYFYNYDQNIFTTEAVLNADAKIYTQAKIQESDLKFTITSKTKKILGYNCVLAQASLNSNAIDVWFTTDLNIKGSPRNYGSTLGLVLEFVVNNNQKITATSISKLKKHKYNLKVPNEITLLNRLDFDDAIYRNRFTNITVFENDTIHFSNKKSTKIGITKYASGTVITKKIKFPKLSNSDQMFLDLTTFSQGDAYDRTGSVFVILPKSNQITFLSALEKGIDQVPAYKNEYKGIVCTPNYEPYIELMRFFTPFGVKKFNHIAIKDKNWEEQVYYRQEISEFNSLLSDNEVIIGTYIGNYDANGHNVSLNISIHKNMSANPGYNFVKPLFNTVNILEMAGQGYPTLFKEEEGLKVTFELEEEVKNASLRYTTTGHGGWTTGDEFLKKKNSIFLNTTLIHEFIPWRVDCGSYRLYNPASGNFANGLSSSDLSRANWCPGTITQPNYIILGDLPKGKHTITIKIPQGEPEGSNLSFWNVSGVLLGN